MSGCRSPVASPSNTVRRDSQSMTVSHNYAQHNASPHTIIAAPEYRETQGARDLFAATPNPIPQLRSRIVDIIKPKPYEIPAAVVGISAPCACPWNNANTPTRQALAASGNRAAVATSNPRIRTEAMIPGSTNGTNTCAMPKQSAGHHYHQKRQPGPTKWLARRVAPPKVRHPTSHKCGQSR